MTPAFLNQIKFNQKILVSFMGFLTLFLVIANIVAASAVSTTGKRLQNLNEQALELSTQNEQLERTVAERKSLSIIAAKAQELGFTTCDKIVSVTTPESLARLP